MRNRKTKELVLMGILTALVFMGQVFMGFLPNIEIVTLLFILYTLVFGKKVFLMIYVFVFLEGFFYGFGIWWASYLYIWSIQALVTLFFRKQKSVVFWSVLSGFFGLFFGLMTGIPYLFTGGLKAAAAYWVSGALMDIVHCIGNVVVCFLLFKPLRLVLEKAVYGNHEMT